MRLDERERRLFAGSLANMLGRGGLKRVSELTGMSRVTVLKGQAESEDLLCDPGAVPITQARHTVH